MIAGIVNYDWFGYSIIFFKKNGAWIEVLYAQKVYPPIVAFQA